jgi:hypothetical protein
MLSGCNSMFSSELPKIIRKIQICALSYCWCLRDVAFSLNAEFFYDEDDEEMKTNTYLLQLFGSKARIVREI